VVRWVLTCQGCRTEFTYTQTEQYPRVRDPFSWAGEKPEMPDGGVELECSQCGNISNYKRHQLTYRAREK
jgi:hypothetical protein